MEYSDIVFIKKCLREAGLEDNEIVVDDERRPNFEIIYEKNEIVAFFCLTNRLIATNEYIVLEYFWIALHKRCKGIFFKRVASIVASKAKELGFEKIIFDVKKSDILLMKRLLGKDYYAESSTGNSVFFYAPYNNIQMMRNEK
jgi:hypothetical protein